VAEAPLLRWWWGRFKLPLCCHYWNTYWETNT